MIITVIIIVNFYVMQETQWGSDNTPHVYQSTCFYSAKKTANVPFLDHQMLEVDCNGREYTNVDHDITLRIPEGAVAEGEKVHFEVGVAMYGPFIFPENTQPISPILWLHLLEKNIKLNKCMELILPHCYTGSVAPPDQITFAIADHSCLNELATDSDRPHYLLKLWEMGTNFYMDQMYGAIQMNFCSHIFCIVKQIKDRHWSQGIRFSLARVDLQQSQTVHEFHFYGLFDLATSRIVSKKKS